MSDNADLDEMDSEAEESPQDPSSVPPGRSSVPVMRARGLRQKVIAQRPPPKKKRKAGVSKILAKEKQRQALELRKAGATYQSIASSLNYADASGARRAVESAIQATIQEPAVEVKTLQIERLNHMLLTLWPKVQQGDERAIDTSLRVMDKIDRLMGTEAAQAIDINVNQTNAILVIDGSKDDYLRSLKQMAGIAGDGSNANSNMSAMNAIGPAAAPPSGIVEGEVINPFDYVTEHEVHVPEAVPLPYVASESDPPKKKYKFGVEPGME